MTDADNVKTKLLVALEAGDRASQHLIATYRDIDVMRDLIGAAETKNADLMSARLAQAIDNIATIQDILNEVSDVAEQVIMRL